MPAPPLYNSFEGAASGTIATTGAAGGETNWTAIDATPAYSTAVVPVANGSRIMAVAIPATYAVQGVHWNALGSFTTAVYFRCYFYLPAAPTAIFRIIRVFTSAAAFSAGVRVDITPTLTALNAAGTAMTGMTTGTLSLNTWYRIELSVTSSTTVGAMTMNVYVGNSLTTFFSNTVTGQVLGANTNQVHFGNYGGTQINYTHYMDAAAASTTGFIGPDSRSSRILTNLRMAVQRAATW